MTAAGAAAGAAAAASKRKLGFDDEAHIAHVDLHAADTFQQRVFKAEGKTVDFKGLIGISRLIQSQCETRAASATGGQVDTDARLGLVREESLKLGTSCFRKMDHCILQSGLLS